MAVRARGATDPASRIESIIAFQERRFRDTWRQAIDLLKGTSTLDDLAELLAAGRFEEALAGLEAAATMMGNLAGEMLSHSARDTAAWLSTNALTVAVSFDQVNVRAVRAMEQNQLRLVREFTSDVRATTRQALVRGIEEGLNPRDQARLFRDSIGLTTRQEQAVANYRRLLLGADRDGRPDLAALQRQLRDGRFDRTVRRAIRLGEPLTEAQVENMVSKYRTRYIRYRSEVIGRTEALRSAHQGTEEMYRQAFESGQINPENVRRKWVTARDERVRSSHRRLNGLTRLVGETYPGDEGPIRYPGDPDAPGAETIQCRCVLSTRIEP